MILIIIAVVSLIVALIRKGSFANLFDNDLKAPYLFILGIVLFVALKVGDGAGISLIQNYAYVIMLVAYIILLLAVVLNFNNVWMVPLLLGIILNFVVIFFNGGKMPISPSMMAIAGVSAETVAASSTAAVADAGTALSFLGGIIPIPLPSIFAEVVSPGTLLIGAGMFGMIQNLMLGIVYEYEEEEEEDEEETADGDAAEEEEKPRKKRRGLFARRDDDAEDEDDEDDYDDDDLPAGKDYTDEKIDLGLSESAGDGLDELDKILDRADNEQPGDTDDESEAPAAADGAEQAVIDDDGSESDEELEQSFTGSLAGLDEAAAEADAVDESEIAAQPEDSGEELNADDFLSGGDDTDDDENDLFGFNETLDGDVAPEDTGDLTEEDDEDFSLLGQEITYGTEEVPAENEYTDTQAGADVTVDESEALTENNGEKKQDVLQRAKEMFDTAEQPEEEHTSAVPLDVDSPYIIVNSRIVENPYYKFRKGAKEEIPDSAQDMSGGVYVMKTRNPSTTGRPSFAPPSRTISADRQEQAAIQPHDNQPEVVKDAAADPAASPDGYEKVEMNIGDVKIRFWKKDNDDDDDDTI